MNRRRGVKHRNCTGVHHRRSSHSLHLSSSSLLLAAVLLRRTVGQFGGRDPVGRDLVRLGLRLVGLVVEVAEEDDEGHGVNDQTPVHPHRKRTVQVQRLNSVSDGNMELNLQQNKHRNIRTQCMLGNE